MGGKGVGAGTGSNPVMPPRLSLPRIAITLVKVRVIAAAAKRLLAFIDTAVAEIQAVIVSLSIRRFPGQGPHQFQPVER